MLSILIVNYKTPGLTIDCINSILTYTKGIEFEIIVVDNGSNDNSGTQITQTFPAISLISLPFNIGFARANNRGMDAARGDAFLLINSDTIIHDNAIANCYLDFMNSSYGACGVQLLNADGSAQISGNYFIPGSLNLILAIPYVGPFVKGLGKTLKTKLPNVPDSQGLTEVDWVNGAFLMVKRMVVDKVGRMDEDFFLYAEEAEWCYRIGKFYNLCLFGQYKVTHLMGVTAASAFKSTDAGYANIFDRKGLQYLLSNFVRIYKQYGWFWLVSHLMIFTCSIPIVAIGSFFSFNNRRIRRKQSQGFFANVLSLWRYCPVILSGRPYFYKVL